MHILSVTSSQSKRCMKNTENSKKMDDYARLRLSSENHSSTIGLFHLHSVVRGNLAFPEVNPKMPHFFTIWKYKRKWIILTCLISGCHTLLRLLCNCLWWHITAKIVTHPRLDRWYVYHISDRVFVWVYNEPLIGVWISWGKVPVIVSLRKFICRGGSNHRKPGPTSNYHCSLQHEHCCATVATTKNGAYDPFPPPPPPFASCPEVCTRQHFARQVAEETIARYIPSKCNKMMRCKLQGK